MVPLGLEDRAALGERHVPGAPQSGGALLDLRRQGGGVDGSVAPTQARVLHGHGVAPAVQAVLVDEPHEDRAGGLAHRQEPGRARLAGVDEAVARRARLDRGQIVVVIGALARGLMDGGDGGGRVAHDQSGGRSREMRIEMALPLVYSSIVSAHISRP